MAAFDWIKQQLFGPPPTPPLPRPTIMRLPAVPRLPAGARAEYDGASYSRRTIGWKRNGLDPNAELHPAAIIALRGIARDLVRNNGYAANAANKLAAYMVGKGIRFHVYRNGEADKDLTARAREHFDSTACDADGRSNLYGLQLLAAQTMVVSGEVMIRRRWRRKKDGLPAPFCMQVLEPDWCNMQMNAAQLPNGGISVQGVDFDAIGRRTGYRLYSQHPGAVLGSALETGVIDAADIAHVYRMHRPGAVHGESWFSPTILRLKDYGEYVDAQLVRQKIAACFAAFRIGDPTEDLPATVDSNGNIIEDAPNNVSLEPGIIEDLPPGSSIEFSDPPTVSDYEPYSRVTRQEIAAGFGLPYEVLTGDLANVSFISGRLGRLDFKQAVETWQDSVLVPQLCEPSGRWLLDAWQMQGVDTTGITIRWTPARFAMMSPETEVPATRDAIRSGQQTISGAARDRGEDPDEFLEEWAKDAAELDRLGLILDCDPRHVTAVGNPVTMTPEQMSAGSGQTQGN